MTERNIRRVWVEKCLGGRQYSFRDETGRPLEVGDEVWVPIFESPGTGRELSKITHIEDIGDKQPR